MWKYGHMRVRALLEREMFPAAMRAAPLAWQFSSLGSIGADWVDELRVSFSKGAYRTAGTPVPVYVLTPHLSLPKPLVHIVLFLLSSRPPEHNTDAGRLAKRANQSCVTVSRWYLLLGSTGRPTVLHT